jgi:hypothetical protein
MKLHGKPNAKILQKAIAMATSFVEGNLAPRKLSNGIFSVLEVSRTDRIVIDGEDLHLMTHEKYNLFVNQR